MVAGVGQMGGFMPVLGFPQPEKGLGEFGAHIEHRVLLRVFRYQYGPSFRVVTVCALVVFGRYEIHGIICAVFPFRINRG